MYHAMPSIFLVAKAERGVEEEREELQKGAHSG